MAPTGQSIHTKRTTAQLVPRVRCLHCHRGSAPATKNEFIPRPIEYTWNGTSYWVREISWQWGLPATRRAQSNMPQPMITAYTPGQYGILTGVFHVDIASGTCKGNVDMPVSRQPIVTMFVRCYWAAHHANAWTISTAPNAR